MIAIFRSLRLALPAEKLGTFGTMGGVAQRHTGNRAVDVFIVTAPLQQAHYLSTFLAAASMCRAGGCPPQAAQDLDALIGECMHCNAAQVAVTARLLVVEAFDDLVRAAARMAGKAGADAPNKVKARDLFGALLPRMLHHLDAVMQHLDFVTEHAAFFARLVAMVTSSMKDTQTQRLFLLANKQHM